MIVYCTTNLKKDIKTYGRENFKKIIINKVDTLEVMKELEVYWIEYFDAFNNPLFYNATKYAAGITNYPENKKINVSNANKGNKYHLGFKQTKFQKSQTSKANLGLKRSKETKKLLSLKKMNNQYALGNKFSQESKDKITKAKKNHPCYLDPKRSEKISIANKGKKRSKECIELLKRKPQNYKPIIQYDLNMNYINEFLSYKHAASFLKKKQATGIIDVCKGNRKIAYGFKWGYK